MTIDNVNFCLMANGREMCWKMSEMTHMTDTVIPAIPVTAAMQ
jgi:hypothetical protein